MRFATMTVLMVCLGLGALSDGLAQGIVTRFDERGVLEWQPPNDVGLASIEWATSTNGPWKSDWLDYLNIAITNTADYSVTVPKYFRIASSPQVLTSTREAQLKTIAMNALAQHKVPGIVYAVKFYDQPPKVFEAGYADVTVVNDQLDEFTGGTPMSPGMKFRIGSATKPFVIMSALKLMQEGKCFLDQPVTTINTNTLTPRLQAHLPSLSGMLDFVTLRMLIQHSSGIPGFTDNDNWVMPYYTNVAMTDDDLLDYAEEAFVTNGGYATYPPPGMVWMYSNTGMVILGMVVEELSGKAIGQYITDTFVTPNGLSGTVYPEPAWAYPTTDGADNAGEYASGYMNIDNFNYAPPGSFGGLTNVTELNPTTMGASGAMVSTAGDLATWGELIARNKLGLGPFMDGVVNWRLYLGMSSGAPIPWDIQGGCGFGMFREPDFINMANYYSIGHRGQIKGYDVMFLVIPEKRCVLSACINRNLLNDPTMASPRDPAEWPKSVSELVLFEMVNVLFPDLVNAGKVIPTAIPVGPVMTPKTGAGDAKDATKVIPPALKPRKTKPLTEYP